ACLRDRTCWRCSLAPHSKVGASQSQQRGRRSIKQNATICTDEICFTAEWLACPRAMRKRICATRIALTADKYHRSITKEGRRRGLPHSAFRAGQSSHGSQDTKINGIVGAGLQEVQPWS